MRIAKLVIILSILFVATSCGSYPELITSNEDIARTPSTVRSLVIRGLPMESYSRLSKFREIRQVRFDEPDGEGIDNARLIVFSGLPFSALKDICLRGCTLIGDEGIRLLSAFNSLCYLQLEATSITDAGAKKIAAITGLRGINVNRCRGLSILGLRALVASDSLEEIAFSTENLHDIEVQDIMTCFKQIKHCEIYDPNGEIDVVRLKTLAEKKKITLIIRRG